MVMVVVVSSLVVLYKERPDGDIVIGDNRDTLIAQLWAARGKWAKSKET